MKKMASCRFDGWSYNQLLKAVKNFFWNSVIVGWLKFFLQVVFRYPLDIPKKIVSAER